MAFIFKYAYAKSFGLDVDDKATVKIEFDPEPRTISMHPKLQHALQKKNCLFKFQ